MTNRCSPTHARARARCDARAGGRLVAVTLAEGARSVWRFVPSLPRRVARALVAAGDACESGDVPAVLLGAGTPAPVIALPLAAFRDLVGVRFTIGAG